MQDHFAVYLDALNHELHETVQRFLPGPAEANLMLRYHLGWVDAKGNPVSVYAGKQVRPLLVLLAAESAGGDWRQALPAAAAVELLHNFSLIHDDIQDGSPLRRGRPTLWKLWGTALAINAGDALFSLAQMALWRLSECGVPSERILRAWQLFEQASLILTRGQHLDISFESRAQVSVDEYLDMINGKSAELIAASAAIGAVLAGADEALVAKYASLGRNLGLAFQIRDDILGIWGQPEVTGKSVATDIVARKKSLPVLYGVERSAEFAAAYAEHLTDELSEVDRLVALLESVGAQGFAQQYESRYFDEVFRLFDVLSIGSDSVLRMLVSFLLGREF